MHSLFNLQVRLVQIITSLSQEIKEAVFYPQTEVTFNLTVMGLYKKTVDEVGLNRTL